MASIRRNLGALSLLLILSLPTFAAEFVGTIVPMELRGKTHYTEVAINGIVEPFLIDTGAGQTFINENTYAVLNALGELRYIKTLYFRQADGSVLEGKLFAVDEMHIGDCRLLNEYVIYAKFVDSSILGNLTLQRVSPFVFDPANNRIILSNCP